MRHTLSRERFWLGIIGAVVAPPLAVLALTLADFGSLPNTWSDWTGLGFIALAATAVTVLGVLGLGLPYLTWLRRRRMLSWFNVCVGAAVSGAVLLGSLVWLGFSADSLPDLKLLGFGAGLGLSSGVGFCLGAGPNNSSKPTPLRGAA